MREIFYIEVAADEARQRAEDHGLVFADDGFEFEMVGQDEVRLPSSTKVSREKLKLSKWCEV